MVIIRGGKTAFTTTAVVHSKQGSGIGGGGRELEQLGM